MVEFMQGSLVMTVAVFGVSALVIAVAGVKLSAVADRLADRTGMGEAIMGALLLGATTSLSGIVTSVTAAWANHPELAVSNAVGGIAAQTAFLAVADLFYPPANLEHAAASHQNVLQGTLLVTLLALPLLAAAGPAYTVFAVHPVTPVALGFYLFGMKRVHFARQEPMWRPRITAETKEDEPAEIPRGERMAGLWLRFLLLAPVVGVAGWFIARAGIGITALTGLPETGVGAIFTAITTSLPELVTSIAAVRQGALTLAVGGIIGGNAFDTLFLAVSDVAYRQGSIYHTIGPGQVFLVALAIVMTGILLLGLLSRERHGAGNIGFESLLLLLLYGLAMPLVFSF